MRLCDLIYYSTIINYIISGIFVFKLFRLMKNAIRRKFFLSDLPLDTLRFILFGELIFPKTIAPSRFVIHNGQPIYIKPDTEVLYIDGGVVYDKINNRVLIYVNELVFSRTEWFDAIFHHELGHIANGHLCQSNSFMNRLKCILVRFHSVYLKREILCDNYAIEHGFGTGLLSCLSYQNNLLPTKFLQSRILNIQKRLVGSCEFKQIKNEVH